MTLNLEADLSNIGLKVEIGFGYTPASPTVTYTDVTAYLEAIPSIVLGGEGGLESYPSATAQFVLVGRDPTTDAADNRFDPDETAGPYYGNILPMVPVRISVLDSGGTRRYLYTGYVRQEQGWVYQYLPNISRVTVNCVDFLTVLGTQSFPASRTVTTWTKKILQIAGQLQLISVPITIDEPVPSYMGLTSGAQLQALLDDSLVPSPAAGWNIGDTVVNVQGFAGAENMLTFIGNLATTEGGAVYVLGDGTVQFDGRYAPISDTRMTTSQFTLDDAAGTTDIPFELDSFTKTFPKKILNAAIVTPTGGEPQTYEDATSIGSFTRSEYSFDGPFDSSAFAMAHAEMVVNRYKDPITTVPSATLDLRRSDDVYDCAVQRKIRDRGTLKYKPAGAAAQITKNVFVSRIRYSLVAGVFKAVFEFSSADRWDFANYADFAFYDVTDWDDGTVYAP